MAVKKWVFLFDEVDQAETYMGNNWENVRSLLGGKGANLADMARFRRAGSTLLYDYDRSLQRFILLPDIFPRGCGTKSWLH